MPALKLQPCLALFALAAFVHAAPLHGHDLTLVVEIRNTRGVIGVLVFNSPEGWPEHVSSAFTSMAVPAQAPRTVVTIPALPAGEYAVVVLHDENSNMKLDRNWLGKPKEQWGMSNNPHAFLSAPSFDSARFPLAGDERLYVWLR
ncbi:MAG: DUF2141 domain-containing protein [Acidobacteria bacterium]|nr:DUF2141 domain-containing protein [Acidobacteriota bacterium]